MCELQDCNKKKKIGKYKTNALGNINGWTYQEGLVEYRPEKYNRLDHQSIDELEIFLCVLVGEETERNRRKEENSFD